MNPIIIFLFAACVFGLPNLSIKLIPPSPPVTLTDAEKVKATQDIVSKTYKVIDMVIASNKALLKTRDFFMSLIGSELSLDYVFHGNPPTDETLTVAFSMAEDLHKLRLYHRLPALTSNYNVFGQNVTDEVINNPMYYFYTALWGAGNYTKHLETTHKDFHEKYVFSANDFKGTMYFNTICAVAQYKYMTPPKQFQWRQLKIEPPPPARPSPDQPSPSDAPAPTPV